MDSIERAALALGITRAEVEAQVEAFLDDTGAACCWVTADAGLLRLRSERTSP